MWLLKCPIKIRQSGTSPFFEGEAELQNMPNITPVCTANIHRQKNSGLERTYHYSQFRPIITRGVCIRTWGPPSKSGKNCRSESYLLDNVKLDICLHIHWILKSVTVCNIVNCPIPCSIQLAQLPKNDLNLNLNYLQIRTTQADKYYQIWKADPQVHLQTPRVMMGRN